jgi:hypothetical protein
VLLLVEAIIIIKKCNDDGAIENIMREIIRKKRKKRGASMYAENEKPSI